jgi:hypothetical protein
MLQRSSLPSSISTEISDSLQQTFSRRWLELLREMLWLPENYRQYLMLLVVTIVVGAGMVVHVWLNVQVAEQRYLLVQLAEQRERIERENSELIYAIADATSLRQIEQTALALGYRPTTALAYVRRDELATSTIPGLMATPASLPAQVLSATSPVREPVAAQVRASPGNDLFDAVGRGLGAAGEWLGQQAKTTTEVMGDLTTGFRERWMR